MSAANPGQVSAKLSKLATLDEIEAYLFRGSEAWSNAGRTSRDAQEQEKHVAAPRLLTYRKCLELSCARENWQTKTVLDRFVDGAEEEARSPSTSSKSKKEKSAVEDEDLSAKPDLQVMKEVETLQNLHLEWQSLGPCVGVALHPFRSLVNLYLQYNRLGDTVWTEVAGLDRLELLALQHNQLTTLAANFQLPVADPTTEEMRKSLLVLDVSGNRIESFAVEKLPESLCILNVMGNPVSLALSDALQRCPDLQVFNGAELETATAVESTKAKGDDAALDVVGVLAQGGDENVEDEKLFDQKTEDDLQASKVQLLEGIRAEFLALDEAKILAAAEDQDKKGPTAGVPSRETNIAAGATRAAEEQNRTTSEEEQPAAEVAEFGDEDAAADAEVLRALAEKKTLLRRKRQIEGEMELAIQLFEKELAQQRLEEAAIDEVDGAEGDNGEEDEDRRENMGNEELELGDIENKAKKSDEKNKNNDIDKNVSTKTLTRRAKLRRQRKELELFEDSLSLEDQYQLWKRAREVTARASLPN
ncbi:unnamed protein product [Amoebophrya sp. A25]|nr:unnamed protein product [Amoebophrya sp. A25]|eukprot:GSA25T00013482001.1